MFLAEQTTIWCGFFGTFLELESPFKSDVPVIGRFYSETEILQHAFFNDPRLEPLDAVRIFNLIIKNAGDSGIHFLMSIANELPEKLKAEVSQTIGSYINAYDLVDGKFLDNYIEQIVLGQITDETAIINFLSRLEAAL